MYKNADWIRLGYVIIFI